MRKVAQICKCCLLVQNSVRKAKNNMDIFFEIIMTSRITRYTVWKKGDFKEFSWMSEQKLCVD